MNDTTVSTLLIIILSCHLATIIIGYKTKEVIKSMSYLNAIFALGLLVFFAINTLKTNRHPFQITEVLALGVEVCILIFAVVAVIGFRNKAYVKVINYMGFWFHLLVSAGMIIFMFTFKMDRLF
ncbi:hypothetical protein ACFFVB_13690 [Formosa undariae]|uniref:Uncharacterized protein n=1 Tax=Formosa undariae TaxID=1325436 RepID=A0ABV5F3W1_9FLAO